MTNPNNCSTCEHKSNPDGGWCYMFKSEPNEVCAKHTPFAMELVTQREPHPNAFFQVPKGTKVKINFRGL